MGKYQLFQSAIEFTDSNENFFDIQYRAWVAMDASSSEFNQWYDSCGDILTVLKGYEKKSSELVVKYANRPLFADLPDLEIYDLSEDSYDEDCFVMPNSEDALDKVAASYNRIVAQQEAEQEYRAERKADRSRVVGGGFGVGGAIKGMATAGAMNAISGAGHSLVNAIGNAGSAIEAASSKRALYNNGATKSILRNGIREDILGCFNAHIELINDRKDDYYEGCFDEDKAGALFENAKKVPAKAIELLSESFKNCPWNAELLKYIFTNYKAERKNVWLAAKRFHVNLKDTAESVFAEMYTNEAKNSEEKAKEIKADILAQMNDLGIVVSATVDQIEKDGVARILSGYDDANTETRKSMFAKVESYDATETNKAKIIHKLGVWELAAQYNVSFTSEEIEKILAKVYTSNARKTEKEALIAKAKMKTIMAALAVENSKIFDELEADCIKRLCPNYQTADEATCNVMLRKIQEYDALDKNKKPFIHGINARIEMIWSAEDGEIFDNVYLNTDIHNENEIKKSIDFIAAKKRTHSGERYITVLKNCNKDNIMKARKYQKPMTKICLFAGWGIVALGLILLLLDIGFVLSVAVAALGVVLLVYRGSLKKAWNILTLNGTLVHSMISLTGSVQRSSTEKTQEEVKAEVDKIVRDRMNIEAALAEKKEED